MNIFDQLYEDPDEDEHLEPVFDIDPFIYYEIDLEYAQGEM
jgi:hypothetical protein